jgi:hypothetical protein
MARNGALPCDVREYSSGKTCRVSIDQFNGDSELIKRIVMRHVVGIRSDIEVPEKFLGYFRYRWGFLILTAPFILPIGLARFIVSLWVRNPHSLWLEWFGTLKQYLRAVPSRLLAASEQNRFVPPQYDCEDDLD